MLNIENPGVNVTKERFLQDFERFLTPFWFGFSNKSLFVQVCSNTPVVPVPF